MLRLLFGLAARTRALCFLQTVDTILGESADAVTGIVRTQYGPGAVIAERADGFLVVDLVYGRAFLRPDAILSRQQGFYAATSMFQLQRLDRLHGMLTLRGLSQEEALWCDDGCLMRCVFASLSARSLLCLLQTRPCYADHSLCGFASFHRHLLTSNWNVDKAYSSLCKTLVWRCGALDAGGFRPQDLELHGMREVIRLFPCFVAGHGKSRRHLMGCFPAPFTNVRSPLQTQSGAQLSS